MQSPVNVVACREPLPSLAVNPYRRLDPEHVIGTIDRLRRRIDERFPGAGLARVAGELHQVAKEHAQRAEKIERASPSVRFFMFAVVAAGGAIGWWVSTTIASGRVDWSASNGSDLLQGIDAALGILLFVLASLALLFSLEIRVKRRRALRAIHELRSIAHIVDMHQLAKDPERVLHAGEGTDTKSSPKRTMSAFELGRYLDYCSELLALTAKISALYAERFDDPRAIAAVDEIEDLTNGLSRKIWQKIMLLDQLAKR